MKTKMTGSFIMQTLTAFTLIFAGLTGIVCAFVVEMPSNAGVIIIALAGVMAFLGGREILKEAYRETYVDGTYSRSAI